MSELTLLSENKVAGGWHRQFKHYSNTLNCEMRFAIYLPPKIELGHRAPVLYWLSGLTCTDENFMQKAGAFKRAAELGMIIVAPDTSPRGDGVPDDENQAYDFGLGAGFYVNATQSPWQQHYQMYDYIVKELPDLIEAEFAVTPQRAISGHSMGGHGALMIALRNPRRYSSVSAFSPICNPSDCPWGIKAFTGYLGDDKTAWLNYDSTHLIKQISHHDFIPALVDQGEQDQFLTAQLKPDALIQAAQLNNYPLVYRSHPGYDHSYYFISSFIDDHLAFHAEYFN
ncbi:S-formylglutathione hydrolase [Pseudoalteromonas tunicata]|uniref:S-formylglutathione hydrolase n=1 Tax=Pseudoalteromonas tunicata TaxID=314281 RepID=UPI00273D1546|nr:S-formylglutathione hydrolase [Pseudoalteromonas tunicata]MDP5211676.1 S-formylglutathione hydrolase [Pseudoalteromonas tunicata]